MLRRRSRRVLWLRFLRWIGGFNRFMFPKVVLSDEQKMGIKIFERAITIKDAEIFMSPLSDSVYIEINDIFIILDGNDLQIINGKFQYDIHYNEDSRLKLKGRVLDVLESRRVEVEKRIKAKSDRTLNSILEDITEIRNKINN